LLTLQERKSVFREIIFMKLKTLVLGAAAAAAALAYAVPASAYVACNREGDCWHTEDRVVRPGIRFDYHPDDWYFHRHWEGDREHRWREYHEGRGYWRNGLWITF
jgi:hypothetical protein